MISALEAAVGRPVPRETVGQLEKYCDLLRRGAAEQNLVSRETLPSLWERHIIDSAQLARFEPRASASWVDVGAGAGLPGVVIGLMVEGPVQLIEPRRLRAEFLSQCVRELNLGDRVSVTCAKAERVTGEFDVITARAVAALPKFLGLAHHLSHPGTVWVLPKGRNAKTELADAQRSWQGAFHVERSVTDAESQIVVATGVRARHT